VLNGYGIDSGRYSKVGKIWFSQIVRILAVVGKFEIIGEAT
jgi:hypothetical protein